MTGPALTMYSTQWCGYCHRLRTQLDREGIGYEVVDIGRVPDAAELVERVNNGNQTVPTLVYADGSAQTNPSVAEARARPASLGGAPAPPSPGLLPSAPAADRRTTPPRATGRARSRSAAEACRARPPRVAARG